jgi:single-strand DNA-binding protein
MAGSLNMVQLIGNLGADPEVRRTQDGRPVVNLRLATNETWKDKATGERKEHVDWHTVVCFNEGLCKVLEQYTRKGSKIYLQGKLQTRKWQDKDGNDRWSTEVVLTNFNSQVTLLDKIEGRPQASSPEDYGQTTKRDESDRRPAPGAALGGKRDDFDDEIPF